MLPPCRMCYFAWKADLKARKEVHNFTKHYLCKRCCERCAAIKPTNSLPELYTYKNFMPDAPYMDTCLTHDEYVQGVPSDDLSPWSGVAGWSLGSCTYDFMHIVYLGLGRGLVASSLKALQMLGFWPDAVSDDHFLKLVSNEMRVTCKAHGFLGLILNWPNVLFTFEAWPATAVTVKGQGV